jgi:flagellar motor switch protein FliN
MTTSDSPQVDSLGNKTMPAFQPTGPDGKNQASINILMDVSMQVTAELGRTRLTLAQILELQHGSVVELDRLAGDPVDIYVNDRFIARGEVVVVDDKFGVRIVELASSVSNHGDK